MVIDDESPALYESELPSTIRSVVGSKRWVLRSDPEELALSEGRKLP